MHIQNNVILLKKIEKIPKELPILVFIKEIKGL